MPGTSAVANVGTAVEVRVVVQRTSTRRAVLCGVRRQRWISDLYKKTVNGKASYCITLENADKKVTLNATPSTTWFVTRVVSKDVASL